MVAGPLAGRGIAQQRVLVDPVAPLVLHHVGDLAGVVAAAARAVEVDRAVPVGVAGAGDVDIRLQRLLEPGEIEPLLRDQPDLVEMEEAVAFGRRRNAVGVLVGAAGPQLQPAQPQCGLTVGLRRTRAALAARGEEAAVQAGRDLHAAEGKAPGGIGHAGAVDLHERKGDHHLGVGHGPRVDAARHLAVGVGVEELNHRAVAGVDAAGPGRLLSDSPEGDLPDQPVAQPVPLLDGQEEQARLAVRPVELAVAVAGRRGADELAQRAPCGRFVERGDRGVGGAREQAGAELDHVAGIEVHVDARPLDRDPTDRPVEVDEGDAAVLDHHRALR
ncbi:MAG: hypothetical protein MUF27_12855 [Acidobacteria bacterium]|nr:hypothetical protein [Acidobacteriota bacterium]